MTALLALCDRYEVSCDEAQIQVRFQQLLRDAMQPDVVGLITRNTLSHFYQN